MLAIAPRTAQNLRLPFRAIELNLSIVEKHYSYNYRKII